MYRYAVCDKENKVINVIKWDGKSPWSAPKDCYSVKIDGIRVSIGDTYAVGSKTFNPVGE